MTRAAVAAPEAAVVASAADLLEAVALLRMKVSVEMAMVMTAVTVATLTLP